MTGRKNSAINQLLGESPAIMAVKSLIRQVAPSDITVLITGESGTGKELVAKAIHDLSARRSGPLMTVNCGAIPEGIFESEIFGHEKGSFTSAEQRRQGYFEMADRGTLFLDEIGEMPLQVQVKILRVLETGRFLRVGGSSEIKVDVRVIAATNKDLATEAAKERFRQDLYYRLKAVSIVLPPLRDRIDDIPMLARHFAHQFSMRNNRPETHFESASMELLRHHYWEGNVRELKNFIESIVALHQGQDITEDIIKSRIGEYRPTGNLPALVSRSSEELNNELIYRTLLELRHELDSIKGLLQQVIPVGQAWVRYPFSTAEEVDALTLADSERDTSRTSVDILEGQKPTIEDAESYSLSELEREQIKRVLGEFNGNRRLAAQALGIGERTLYRKLKQYNLK